MYKSKVGVYFCTWDTSHFPVGQYCGVSLSCLHWCLPCPPQIVYIVFWWYHPFPALNHELALGLCYMLYLAFLYMTWDFCCLYFSTVCTPSLKYICVCAYIYMYMYICMHIHKIPVISQSLAEGHGILQPGGRTASLLIVFATSVSESSLLHFPFRRLNGAKLQVFAIPMAAIWGSWDDSLVFFKPHFGALSAVLAPFFAWWCSVCTYICVTVTLACLLCLAYSIWGQDARTTAFSVCLRLYQLQVTPVYLLCLSCFFPLPSLGRGGGVLIRVEMSCGWLMAFSPLHDLLRAGWMACYFTKFPNI